MAIKTKAYVDTSAFIAFFDKSDSHHILFRDLFQAPPPLCTSSLVIAEAHGWFLRRYDETRALTFLAFLGEAPPLEVRPFDHSELDKATRILRKFADQKLTLADAHGLSIMKESRITDCWSTDGHLSLHGAKLATTRYMQ